MMVENNLANNESDAGLMGASPLDVYRHILQHEELTSGSYCVVKSTLPFEWCGGEKNYIHAIDFLKGDPFEKIRPGSDDDTEFGLFSMIGEPTGDGGWYHLPMLSLDISKSSENLDVIKKMLTSDYESPLGPFRYGRTWVMETNNSYQLLGDAFVKYEDVAEMMGYLLTCPSELLNVKSISMVLQNHGSAIRIPNNKHPEFYSKVVAVI